MAKDKAVHVLAVEDGRLETRIAKAHGCVPGRAGPGRGSPDCGSAPG